MEHFSIAIVGGGAAGAACAVRLAQLNLSKGVVLIEKSDRLGKKLAATGNGQGNVTNVHMSAEHYFGSAKPLAETLCCADYQSALSLFSQLFTADEFGRVYPAGKQASSLTDSMLFTLKHSGVKMLLGDGVQSVEKGFCLTLDSGKKITADFVVLATGGKAQKQFKTDGSAYALATRLGHTLTPLYPSLVQCKTDVTHIKTLKGIRCDCLASAIVEGKQVKTVRGDVIFTDYGVSGNAVFTLSPYVTDKQNAQIKLEFLPDFTYEQVCKIVKCRRALGYETAELLGGSLHNQVGRAIIKRTDGSIEQIAATVKNFTLSVLGTLGFDYAQVTRGGIPANELTQKLESKLVKNLFLTGEMVDVDGDCGGYNLHWAFNSGIAVAEELANRL